MKVVKVSLYNVSFYLFLFFISKNEKIFAFFVVVYFFLCILQCYFFLFVSCFRKTNIKQKKTK